MSVSASASVSSNSVCVCVSERERERERSEGLGGGGGGDVWWELQILGHKMSQEVGSKVLRGEVLEEPQHERILVLYGSQTGNAEDVAHDLQRQLEGQELTYGPSISGSGTPISGSGTNTCSYNTYCCTMDAYDVFSLPNETFVLFITSTTGQGDPPDNMRNFWRFLLRRSLPSNSLENMKYAVFGLGDSSYPKYNTCARKLYKRLEDLGAQSLVPIGLGDDQHPKGG